MARRLYGRETTMRFTVLAFAGLLAGCAAKFVATPSQPSHTVLKSTYDPSQVRDAAAHVVSRRHWLLDESDGVIRGTDSEHGCVLDVAYTDRAFEIRTTPLAGAAGAADGRIDSRCVDETAKLGKLIVKEVERPAKLAEKEEKRRRRAERLSAAMSVLGTVANVAGTAAGVAGSVGGSSSSPAPQRSSYHYGGSAQSTSTVSSTSQATWNGQPVSQDRVFSASGQPFTCPHFASEQCMVSNVCGACAFDPSGGQAVTITRPGRR
jgi:hypothetical protein